MPTDESILNFSNKWYPLAIRKTTELQLSEEITINLVTATMFVCTKFEAFSERGKNDYFGSSDIEDIVAIVNGRTEFLAECRREDIEVKHYLAGNFARLLGDENFLNALPGILPYAARNREAIVVQAIAAIGSVI